MLKTQLYINGERVDLFEDEQININLSIKNLSDITKVFTDFTQGFTIPASPTNNAILEHWHNIDVEVSSFNPSFKLPARIDLNGAIFRTGVVALDGAKVVNGRVENYSITFYGDLRSLSNLFGQTKLFDLDLSAYELSQIDWGSTLETTEISGNVLTPLISQGRLFKYYDAAVYDVDDNAGDIFEDPVQLVETRPALKVKKVLEAIEDDFGITFTSTFFSSADFAKLFIHANRTSGRRPFVLQGWVNVFDYVSQDGSPPVNTWNASTKKFDISSGLSIYDTDGIVKFRVTTTPIGVKSQNKEYTLHLLESITNTYQRVTTSGASFIVFDIEIPASGTNSLTLYMSSVEPLAANVEANTLLQDSESSLVRSVDSDPDGLPMWGSNATFNFSTKTITQLGQTVTVDGNMPDITVNDFMSGLIKMFNLVIEPITATNYRIEPLDNWYALGTDVDFSDYVDGQNYDVALRDAPGNVQFRFQPDDGVLNKQFRDVTGGGVDTYGDLIADIVDSNGDAINASQLLFELPFINHLWERLREEDGTLTDFLVAQGVTIEGTEVKSKPYIFYFNSTEATDDWRFRLTYNTNMGLTTASTYNACYNFNTLNDSYTRSLNFGTEINPYTGVDAGISSPTLYRTYYEDYITDLYDVQSRRIRFTGKLPVGLILTLNLKNEIIINRHRYRINSAQVNLTSGEATLDLLNIIE